MATFEIPDDLDALELPIGDKIALAAMRQRPKISNGCLRKILGLTDSGVRALIRRLRSQQLITMLRIDGEREFRVRVGQQPFVEGGRQKVTKNDAIEIRQKMTAEPPAGLTPEERGLWKAAYYSKELLSLQQAVLTINTCRMCGYYTVEFQQMMEQIEADLDVPEAIKAALLTFARYHRNHQIAAGYAVDHLPRKKAVEVLKVLQGATPDQLGKLYERIQAEKALGGGGGAKALLLDIGSPETISLQATKT